MLNIFLFELPHTRTFVHRLENLICDLTLGVKGTVVDLWLRQPRALLTNLTPKRQLTYT